MILDNEKTAVQAIDHESFICVRENLLIQGKEILFAGLTANCSEVHGKVFTEYVVIFKN